MRVHTGGSGALGLRGAALLACACLGASGCEMLTASSGVPQEEPCAWINESTAEAGGETVVMLDGSASMLRSESGEIPDYTEDIADEMLRGFHQDAERRLTLAVFSGQKSHITYVFEDAVRPARLDQNSEEQEREIRDCIAEQVDAAAANTPSGPENAGTDVLAAIDTGARGFTGGGDRRLTIVTDGHSNIGCLNLNRVLAEPDYDAIESECVEEKEWPAADFSGITLRLVGVSGAGVEHSGGVTGAQTLGQVSEFWNTIGGRLPGAEGEPVVVDSAPEWGDLPEGKLPADPPIAVSGSGDLLVIDAEALFKTDSATLLPTARQGIDEVLESHGSTLDPGLGVTVTGHTDSRGSASYNADLSQRRAEAVREHLEAAGFTDVRAEGEGSSQPVCDDGGEEAFDEECGRLNRRVEIRFNQE